MAVNRDTKTYPGGIRNRIHRIVVRIGDVNVQYNDSYPGQNTGARLLIDRISGEPPVARSLNDGTKDTDV